MLQAYQGASHPCTAMHKFVSCFELFPIESSPVPYGGGKSSPLGCALNDDHFDLLRLEGSHALDEPSLYPAPKPSLTPVPSSEKLHAFSHDEMLRVALLTGGSGLGDIGAADSAVPCLEHWMPRALDASSIAKVSESVGCSPMEAHLPHWQTPELTQCSIHSMPSLYRLLV